ncbi:S-adenosyl-L-methionine-dependent methyltransferase [Mycena rebaudengoi]|nr:S-adenosyl-L-methionine-dependent methyltransferase [Mycena rebaudengoi]
MDTLLQLLKLISTSVTALDVICSEDGVPFPNLDDQFAPQSERFRENPAAAEATTLIAAAALQMVASVLPPSLSAFHAITGHFKSAALRICLETNVVETLREVGPSGMHVNELASKLKLDPVKLGRALRYLATHHIFREIKPDVFANNRISGTLDTGKTLEALQDSPRDKYDRTSGFAALAGHLLDESHKASAYAFENFIDEETKYSGEPFHAPFNRAFNTELPFWEWIESPDQFDRFHRFGIGMQGVARMESANAILDGFNWESLDDGAVVVDVGAGVGASSLQLVEKFPHLRVIVQDRPAVVAEGIKLWMDKLPEAMETGRVQFQAYNFFDSQPVHNASVFLMKQILHDWSDTYASRILVQLRRSAAPSTKLVLFESILPYACRTGEATGEIISAPPPLLSNYGAVNVMGYNADMAMLFHHNSQERTLAHMERLLQAAGWKILRVNARNTADNFLTPCIAVPL